MAKTKKKATKKKAAKKATKKKPGKPRALVAAEERVVGLRHLVQAAESAQKAHKLLAGTSPKACTNAIATARKALQRGIKACAK